LGHEFLRHIERTRLLLHLVDGSSDDVVADLAVVEEELRAYGHGLAERPRLVVLSKAELLDAPTLAERLTALAEHLAGPGALPAHGAPLAISAATGQGLEALKAAVWGLLESEPNAPDPAQVALSTPDPWGPSPGVEP
jgi:GTP-binding protein